MAESGVVDQSRSPHEKQEAEVDWGPEHYLADEAIPQ